MWGLDKLSRLIDLGEDEFEDEEFEEIESEEEEESMELKTATVGAAPIATAAATQKPTHVAPQKTSTTAVRPKLTVHTTKTPELAMEIHVPSNFDQVARIADDLLANRAAVVNYERVDLPEQRRICDFINGVSYVLDCEARRISDIMVIYVPSGVDVSSAKPKAVRN
jgi:cell division inhibitor SepF